MAKKTIYCLIDTETTKANGLVFDFAYQFRTKHGNVKAAGSFLFKDVLALEEPFYKNKIAEYWNLVYKKRVKPVSVRTARRIFNKSLSGFLESGNKVVITAYNAAFDISHLALTCEGMTGKRFLESHNKSVHFMDLWHAWVMGCPVAYGYTAPISDKGNIRTSAEAVYRFLANNHSFEERHIAHSDLIIEGIILQDVIARKKKMPIVSHPKDFVGSPWRIAQQRCKVPIEIRKAKQQSLPGIGEDIPDLSTKKIITFE